MLAHEQIELGGNTSINAQIMAEDAANVSNLVTGNVIHGSVVVTYNGGLNDDMLHRLRVAGRSLASSTAYSGGFSLAHAHASVRSRRTLL